MNRSAVPPSIALRSALALLPLAALAISGYLAWLSLSGGATPVGCGEGDVVDCLHVLKSRWATWLGLPVTIPASVVYAAMLVSAILIGPWFSSGVRRTAWLVLMMLAVVVAGAALWFIGLQLFLLDTLCVYCIAAHTCGLLAAALILWRAPIEWQPTQKRQRLKINASLAANLIPDAAGPSVTKVAVTSAIAAYSSGLLLVGLLVAGHLLMPQATFVVQSAADVKPVAVPQPEPVDATSIASTPTSIANDSVHTALYPPHDGETELPSASDSADETSAESSTPARSEALTADDELDAEVAADSQGAGLELEPLFPLAKNSQPVNKGNAATGANDLLPELVGDAPPLDPLRTLSLLDGDVKLKLADQMLIGPPSARHVVVKLFDYTCPHCRLMHRQLEEARKHYGDQMAIVLLPVPLNKGCNPLVKFTHPHHDFACLYARMAWAVWKHKPKQFAKFHDWLMTGPDAPAPGVARLQLVRVLGSQLAEDAPSEPWVDEQITECVEVYGKTGAERIPKLIIGDSLMTGETNSSDELMKVLSKHFSPSPRSR